MKKKIVAIGMLGFLVCLFAAVPVFASGATKLPLTYGWFSSSPLPPSDFGKVIFNIPDSSSKMVITWILQGASPSTSYDVGFDTAYLVGQTEFGQLSAIYAGLYNVFVVGTITTDAYGAGSFHINVNDIATGTYVVIFWVAPTGTLSPVASSGNWDVQATWTTVIF